jgi:hypothetical protein
MRRPYFETLLANFKEGLNKLKAIDQYWKLLQRRDRWYLIVPISMIQRSDFSDVSNRRVDYSNVMTQINKKWKRGKKPVVPVKSRVDKLIKNVTGGGNLWFM